MSKQYKIETRLFIDGKFVDGHSGKKFPLYNPATEEVVVEVNEADEYDVDEAVAAAKKAFPAWSKSPSQYKAGLLRKLAQLIRRDVDELGYLEAVSMGRYSALLQPSLILY
jgi:aldehyde dehydrogenase (NAD+)